MLLGREPNALSAELEAAGPISVVPPEVPVGAPADVLRRRPDVRRAERQLAAATARIGVATADLYPRLSLTGSFTLDATEFSKFGDWSSRAFNVGPTLTWPVFDAGRIRSTIHVADARQQQALSHYEQTVLIAFREVEDALVGYATEQSRRAGLAASLESARKSVDLANDQYKAGAVDLLVVLDAQRTQFAAEDLLALSDRAVTTYLVTLYKALGGGWDADPTTFAEKVRSGSVNP